MKFLYQKLGLEILATVIGGVVLSLMFFVFSDFIHTTPNLSGRWYFVNETRSTSYNPFRGLKVTYTVLLTQEGAKVFGTGEKIEDELDGKSTRYSGQDRVHITVSGYLQNNFLLKDTLNIHYVEQGRARSSSTLHNLVRFSDTAMGGEFFSTIADSEGSVSWSRTEPE